MAKRNASPSSPPSSKGPATSKRQKISNSRRTSQIVPSTTPHTAPPSRPVLSFAEHDEQSVEDLAVYLFNTGQVDIASGYETSDDSLDSPEIKDKPLRSIPRKQQAPAVKEEPLTSGTLEKSMSPECIWWTPREHLEYTEDDPQYKVIRSRTVFESDDLDPENYMRKPTLDQFDWKYEREGDEKPRDWNQPRGKKVQSSGYRVVGDTLKPRRSATEKYLKWRTTNFASDRPAQKYPRDIILLEHEPLGVIGEAGSWGNSYSTLPFNANLARGSSITLHIAVSDNPLNTRGISIEWHRAIMTMLERWVAKPGASTISVIIEDDSILRTNVAALYPADLVDSDKRKNKIDEDVARAWKFVSDVRHFQATGTVPPKEAAPKKRR